MSLAANYDQVFDLYAMMEGIVFEEVHTHPVASQEEIYRAVLARPEFDAMIHNKEFQRLSVSAQDFVSRAVLAEVSYQRVRQAAVLSKDIEGPILAAIRVADIQTIALQVKGKFTELKDSGCFSYNPFVERVYAADYSSGGSGCLPANQSFFRMMRGFSGTVNVLQARINVDRQGALQSNSPWRYLSYVRLTIMYRTAQGLQTIAEGRMWQRGSFSAVCKTSSFKVATFLVMVNPKQTSLLDLERDIVSVIPQDGYDTHALSAILQTNERADEQTFSAVRESNQSPNGYIIGVGVGNIFTMLELFADPVQTKGIVAVEADPSVVLYGRILRALFKIYPSYDTFHAAINNFQIVEAIRSTVVEKSKMWNCELFCICSLEKLINKGT